MTTKTQRNLRGFTIVELLIVIVIIAILAAITIVAYNGIQQRVRDSAAAGAASQLSTKVEAWNSQKQRSILTLRRRSSHLVHQTTTLLSCTPSVVVVRVRKSPTRRATKPRISSEAAAKLILSINKNTRSLAGVLDMRMYYYCA